MPTTINGSGSADFHTALPVAEGGTGATASTGSGNVVLSASPTLTTPALGTPASGVVTNLTGTASININGTVGATTPAAATVTSLNGGQLAGNRNKIINGDMRINQRHGTSTITLGSAATNTFVADRTRAFKGTSGGVMTGRKADASTLGGFYDCFEVKTTTAATASSGDINAIWQAVEGFNFSDMSFGTANAKSFTLSFWMHANTAGSYGVSFLGNMAQSNRSYTTAVTVSAGQANSWVQHSVTVPGDTTGTGWVTADSTNGVSMYVGICDIGSGSAYETSTADTWQAGNFKRKASDVKLISVLNATIYITGVQLEAGTVATPFEHRSYGTELALCQRYYQQWGGDTAYGFFGGVSSCTTTSTAFHPMLCEVEMRANPSFAFVGAASVFDLRNDANGSHPLTGLAMDQSTRKVVSITLTRSNADLTVNVPSQLIGNNSTAGRLELRAEL